MNEETINLEKELTNIELSIIRKLEVEINKGFYTPCEYQNLKEHLGIYHIMNENDKELKYLKPSKYGVSKNEYNQLCNKFEEIDNKYANLLNSNFRRTSFENVWLRERQHIRDKLITILNKKNLNNTQKQQIYDFVMNMESATDIQKNRFILYYGLDKNNNEVHTISQIAKLHNCTPSNIRQSINHLKSGIVRLSNEKIEILRQIVNKLNY